MAVTLVAAPNFYQPGYNPVHIIADSTEKARDGFRYLFVIYDQSDTLFTNPLAEVKVAPRPVDGLGYADISKILQTQIDKTDPFTNVSFISADINSVYNYKIVCGEEYELSYDFDDFYFNNLPPIPAGQNRTSIGNSGTLVPLGPLWPFVTGDQILIQATPPLAAGDFRNAILGVFNVENVGGLPPHVTREVVINKGWIGSGSGFAGTVKYADGRKFRSITPASPGTVTVSDLRIFNGAFSFPAFQVYDDAPYLPPTGPTGDPALFMTSIPRDCYVAYPFQEFYHQLLTGGPTGASITTTTTINFENSEGNLYSDQVGVTGTNARELQFNVSAGITWPTQTSGPAGPVVGPNTEWYEYWLEKCDCCDIIVSYENISTGISQTFTEYSSGLTEDGYCWFTWFDTQLSTNVTMFFDSPTVGNGTNEFVIVKNLSAPGIYSPTDLLAHWTLFSPAPPCPPISDPGISDWTIVTDITNLVTSLQPCRQLTERLRIYINRNCPINTTQVLFLDRLGSWSSYAFPLRTLESGTVERNEYRKEAGYIESSFTPSTGNGWFYNSYDRGLINYNIKHTKEFTLNTDWMPDCMSLYFEELITTPYAFVKFDPDIKQDFDASKWYAIQVLDTNWQTTRSKNKRLIRYTIRIKCAIDNPINV